MEAHGVGGWSILSGPILSGAVGRVLAAAQYRSQACPQLQVAGAAREEVVGSGLEGSSTSGCWCAS